MSDYLSRLAAKSLSAAEVLQPRLPSLFEPIPYGPFSKRSVTFEEAIEPGSKATKPETIGRLIAPYSGQRYESSHDSKPIVQKQYSKTVEDLSAPRGLHTSEYRQKVEDPYSQEDRSSHEEISEHQVGKAEEDAHARPADAKARVLQPRNHVDIPAALIHDGARIEKPGGLVKSSNIEHYIEPTTFDVMPDLGPPRQLLNTERIALFTEPLSSAQARKIPVSKALPIIKVNIGRIEVKADVQPPQPRKRAAQTPPKISLEEYLRQRSGGKT